MVGVCDSLDVLRGKYPGPAVDEVAFIPGIDKKNLFTSAAAAGLVSVEKPETGGDLGVQEELCR